MTKRFFLWLGKAAVAGILAFLLLSLFCFFYSNNDGFNNLRDYTPGEQIDVLLMGSSHMEAFNVAQDKSTASVLNRLFDGKKYVYSIGTAGHTLPYCVKHLGSALDTYVPAQYVLLETASLDLTPADMEGALDGSLADIPSYTGGLVGLLQRVPLLRLLYTKYFKNTLAFGGDAPEAPAGADTELERVRLTLKKSDIFDVRLCLLWTPVE